MKRKEKSKKEKENQQCHHCFQMAHSRPTSLNCLLNKKNTKQQKEELIAKLIDI
jgi:hypothetical protein